MKIKTFYCHIGPKPTVSTGINGLSTSMASELRILDNINTGNKNTACAENIKAPQEFEYLKGVDFGNVNLQRD